ncbi:hypothetical protein PQR02_40010, partial [Paraburkholderia sediminicola]|uniref:hypothetical protein n=1 Tax=Paraburkholderia sediminicola TaxID=458836 RepID=UPI0038B884D9
RARLLGHRQTKGAATDKPNLLPPRHISTLPTYLFACRAEAIAVAGVWETLCGHDRTLESTTWIVNNHPLVSG